MEKLNKEVPRVPNSDIRKVLNLLELMDVINTFSDSSEIDFSEIQNELVREFLDQEGNFQFDIFFREIHKTIGPNFKNLIAGYKAMIDAFCDPDAEILQASANVFAPGKDDLLVKAEEVCEFANFGMWVNKAASWIGSFNPNEKVICIDSNGHTLTNGRDFQHARETNSFPIKAYRLKRNSEEGIVKSLSNN